jgi:hypothetical protein
MAGNSRVQPSTAPKMLVLDSLSMSLIPMTCSCTCTHRSRKSVPLIRTIVNALHLVADMELLALMTTTTVLVDRFLVATVRVVTTVSDHLVDDLMTTMPVVTMDDAHHREETHTDHRRLLDENHTAMILTIEAHRHHREATVLIRTPVMVIRTGVGHAPRQEQVMEAAMQPIMTEDTGEFPASIHDSALLASVESHFLRLICIDHVRRGDIIAERIPF